MSATAVTSSLPTCRCLISAGRRSFSGDFINHIPYVLERGSTIQPMEETKFCQYWRLVVLIILLVCARMILYRLILSTVGEDLTFLSAFLLSLTASLHVSLNQTVLRFRIQNLLLGIVSVAIVIIFSVRSSSVMLELSCPNWSVA